MSDTIGINLRAVRLKMFIALSANVLGAMISRFGFAACRIPAFAIDEDAAGVGFGFKPRGAADCHSGGRACIWINRDFASADTNAKHAARAWLRDTRIVARGAFVQPYRKVKRLIGRGEGEKRTVPRSHHDIVSRSTAAFRKRIADQPLYLLVKRERRLNPERILKQA